MAGIAAVVLETRAQLKNGRIVCLLNTGPPIGSWSFYAIAPARFNLHHHEHPERDSEPDTSVPYSANCIEYSSLTNDPPSVNIRCPRVSSLSTPLPPFVSSSLPWLESWNRNNYVGLRVSPFSGSAWAVVVRSRRSGGTRLYTDGVGQIHAVSPRELGGIALCGCTLGK
ncbi:hypothetical protein LY76DRAFT_402553 [Colletotrichum caudatum]|nr:hypothetical protein LY76DRAFT_402553 [Colletotrichum caudatum]